MIPYDGYCILYLKIYIYKKKKKKYSYCHFNTNLYGVDLRKQFYLHSGKFNKATLTNIHHNFNMLKMVHNNINQSVKTNWFVSNVMKSSHVLSLVQLTDMSF